MKTLSISKKISSFTELINDEQYKAIFSGFENRHKDNGSRVEFKAAYFVETDPAQNYGQNADIYEYFVIGGLHRLMKIKLGSSLDNGPMFVATISEADGKINIHDHLPMAKCEQNRALAKQYKMIIF